MHHWLSVLEILNRVLEWLSTDETQDIEQIQDIDGGLLGVQTRCPSLNNFTVAYN
jgi:hypothetical protein